jgi:hypothetical protein
MLLAAGISVAVVLAAFAIAIASARATAAGALASKERLDALAPLGADFLVLAFDREHVALVGLRELDRQHVHRTTSVNQFRV